MKYLSNQFLEAVVLEDKIFDKKIFKPFALTLVKNFKVTHFFKRFIFRWDYEL